MNLKLTYILCSLGGIFIGLSFNGGGWMLLALVGLLAFVFAYLYNSSRESSDSPIPSIIQRNADTTSLKTARVTTRTAVIEAIENEYVPEEPLVDYRKTQYWKTVDNDLSRALGDELSLLAGIIPNVHSAVFFMLRSKDETFSPVKAVGEGASKINRQAQIGSSSGSLFSRLLRPEESQILEGDLNGAKTLQIYNQDLPVRSVIAVPVYNHRKNRNGFLMLDSLQMNAFQNVSPKTLARAASVIQTLCSKLYAAANNYIQQEQYAVLYRYQKNFFQSMSVKDVYRHIGEFIKSNIVFDRMMLISKDLQDDDKIKVVLCEGEDCDYFQGREFSINQTGLLILALEKNYAIERKFTPKEYVARFEPSERPNESFRYLYALPSGMTPNFAIVLERSIPESYSEHDKSILQTITSTAGFALERVLQFEKGKDLAMRDGLTGLINHRTMHEKLYAENLRAERQKVNIGLLMMDIDKFKSINDTYGHPAGDEILKGIAKTIMSEVRSEIDLVARYGGEEFVVALIDTSESGLKETAERIRKTIEATSYNIKQKLPLNVTVSIGAYLKHPNGKYSMAECLKFADTALYKAKEGGRNQVKEYLESEPDVLVQDSE